MLFLWLARPTDETAPSVEGVVLTRVSSLSGYDSASTDGRLDRCMPLVKLTQKMRKKKK